MLFIIIVAFALQTSAQISSGGSPAIGVDMADGIYKSNKEHFYTPSKAQLKNSDKQYKGEALKFAHQFTVNYTPENSGVWSTLDDGTKIWRILISSMGAYSINLIFDRYNLAEGCKLFVYNTDMSDVKGAFTSLNNQPSGVLATAPVIGDEIIVEFQQPANANGNTELMIGAVNHDYLGIHKLKYSGLWNRSDKSCAEDISCYDTDNVLDIKRSVVRLIVDGTELCTATLINNTGELKPYIISAAHCFKRDKTGSSAVVYFNYEIPYCSDIIEGYDEHTLSGAQARVIVDSLDIALIEMNNMPPAYYRPYFAGWTLSSSPKKPFKAIHHPQGDVKKIATYNGDLLPFSWTEPLNHPYAQMPNFHWRIPKWTTSTTEGGSSGGPLFDQNGLFVGSLSGGAAVCSNPVNDYYVQFYKAWDELNATNEHFKPWLDPRGLGVQSLLGVDPFEGEGFVRLTNIETGDKPSNSYISQGGLLSGHNAIKNTVFVEEFSGIKSATVRGVYFTPSKVTWGSNQTFDLVIWQGTQTPESLVARKKDIELSELGSYSSHINEEKYFEFTPPVKVTGNFFVGYEINYANDPVDTLAVYYSERDGKINNTMLTFDANEGWRYASDLYVGNNYSLWLDVLAEMVVYGDTQVTNKKGNDIALFPIPLKNSIVYLNSQMQLVKNYEVYDIKGQLIMSGELNVSGSEIPIAIDGLGSGVYIFKFNVENNYIHKKIIVP